ncbi:hypothetical protein NFI99_12645 (plasmid) [Burkholderia glumae]|uniref:Uncharacterized protein n=1 Tax=Burkholderia glumae TaxID=337 RepID=A0ABY5BBV6_BURGL|nr:hypothetical protein [Burkholderia glumae]USS44134.1 hypothetical protein NFI99_12645 [Burkholderia glumae]
MIQHLVMTPIELSQELEAAALRYAAMSPSDFIDDELRVEVTTLRNIGMIGMETWARVPAGGTVLVVRRDGEQRARVLLPWQPSAQ